MDIEGGVNKSHRPASSSRLGTPRHNAFEIRFKASRLWFYPFHYIYPFFSPPTFSPSLSVPQLHVYSSSSSPFDNSSPQLYLR